MTEREWGWRSALAAFGLVVVAGYGCLAYVGRPLAWPGAPLPFLAFSAAVVAGCWAVLSPWGRRLPRVLVAALTAVVLVAGVAWYARYEPTHAPFADNADALRLGVRQLLAGRSPYAVHTFLDGPITPMLGGFLLALPFVVVGGLFLLQPAWLLGAGTALLRTLGPRAALVAGALFVSSPWARMALPYQSDTWICAVAVAAAGSAGSWALARRRDGGVWWWATSLLFGVALAYRFILWIAVVPLGVYLLRRYGWRRAVAWLTPAGVVTVVLAGLPLLFDLSGYREGPIGTGLSKANHDAIPGGMWFVLAATVAVLVVGAVRVRSLSGVWVTTAAALVAMVLTIVATKLPALGTQAFSTYDTLAYNGAFLVFGVLALVLPTARPAPTAMPVHEPTSH